MSPERSSERPIRQYFLEEYTPNGRLAEFDDNGLCVRAWTDPRVKKAEARVGPNGQIAALRAQGVPVDQLVKVGAGFGLGSICFASLAECATAVAHAIEQNERYRSFRELTEQEKVRLAREQAAASHAYWCEEAAASQRAWEQETGLFKGCYTMLGRPLCEESKRAILAYLNAPSLEQWLEIRGFVIAGTTTLWQAWCQHDADAPRSGSVGHPAPDTLREAIRAAVAARRVEIEDRCRKTHPTGLTVVNGSEL